MLVKGAPADNRVTFYVPPDFTSFTLNNWKRISVYSALWLLIPWCWSTGQSVSPVLTKYSLHWTSFTQKYHSYSEQHNEILIYLEKKIEQVECLRSKDPPPPPPPPPNLFLSYHVASLGHNDLTHWGRVTHISVSKLTFIGSDNGLSPDWHQVIIWTNFCWLDP